LGGWASPPMLLLVVLLAAFWLRRHRTHERPLV
jgi:MYXO-CTERM domain-containing protein